MKSFIELHREGKEEEAVLLNVNQIFFIENVKNEAIIHLIGESRVLNVKESYEEVRVLILGK